MNNLNKLYKCFATTNRGLEQVLSEEFSSLGAINIEIVVSGILFEATMQTVMQLNLHSRLASRIMLQLISDDYYNENDIYSLAYSINWDEWFTVDHNTIKVSSSAIKSPLRSLNFVTLKVKDAICDKFVSKYHKRPDVDKKNPTMRIYLFLNEKTATIYLDTSGEALFKRMYRNNKLEAPIRENLAAGLLRLTNWTPNSILYDPMCGSGTIVIEAILMGLNIPVGLNRKFAFMHFVFFNKMQVAWQDMLNIAKQSINYAQNLKIFASDIDSMAIKSATENLNNLSLLKYITIVTGDFLKNPLTNDISKAYSTISNSDLNSSDTTSNVSPAIMLTNPPYGVRLDINDVNNTLYEDIASNLKKHYANWDCYFITADLDLPKFMRLKPSRKIPVMNADLDCRLFKFSMVEGSNRKRPQ